MKWIEYNNDEWKRSLLQAARSLSLDNIRVNVEGECSGLCSVWSPGDYSVAAPYTRLHLATTRVTINAENRMNECVSCFHYLKL